MSFLPDLSADELRGYRDRIRERYGEFARRGLKLNLTRGKPSSEQLDLCNELLTLPGAGNYRSGALDCRNYGDLAGLTELRALLAPLYGASADTAILGDNSSLSLMHDAIVFSMLKGNCDSERPWTKEERVAFLCPVPGYDRHFSICEEFGIELLPVPMTEHGPDMNQVEQLAGADPAIKGMWCVPKYSNPTGTVYSADTVERLAKMRTAARDFRLFWDNAYVAHHLTPQRIEIADMLAACERHGHPNRAFVFGSTSKMTFAGGGVGLFAGSRENVAWYLKRMEKRTIGGDKINQLRQLQLLGRVGGVAPLMDAHRAILAPKFAKVQEVFEEHLAGTGVAQWTRPKGGYFLALDVLPGCARQVVALARDAGLELTPAGATHPYGRDPEDRTLRIAPSFPALPEVAQAAEGVVLAVLLACAEKLLAGR